jgi:hypothetical protein
MVLDEWLSGGGYGGWPEDECLGMWGCLVALSGALKSDLVTHRPALAGVRGMSQAGATATSDGQEGRERNPWIKSRPRLDLQGMRHFSTRSANSRGRWRLAPDVEKPTDAPLTFDI